MTDFALQIETLRPQLLRFARVQLRNDAWAEDAVSETLLAALEKPHAFAGGSQLKTWLVGILKHKLVDQMRRNLRNVSLTAEGEGEQDVDELMFLADGHFCDQPQEWCNPEAALGERQFFAVLEACVERLPKQMGRVFMMREWLELETDEICNEVGITATNLGVTLHRARLRLRKCLQASWFAAPRH